MSPRAKKPAVGKGRLLGCSVVGILVIVALYALPPVRQGVRLTLLFFANDGTPAEWSGPETSVSLPFRYEVHVLLPVRVNGGPSLPFALDTGAPFPGIIGGPWLDELDLDLGGTVSVGGSGSGEAPPGRVARNLTFAFGPVELRRQSAVLMPWQVLETFFDSADEVYMQGILGYDLFRRYVVEIDFEKESLTLHRPDAFRYAGDGEILPLDFTQRKPYVTAQATLTGGATLPVKLHLDLGKRSTMSLIPGSRPEIVTPRDTVAVTGYGLSGRVEKRMGRVRELRFGRHPLRDVICSFPESGHATAGGRQGVIGLRVLSRFRVILDYPRKRVIFERTTETDRPFEADMSGATFVPHGDRYVLKRLRAGSPAADAGLREGDLLVRVDGDPAEKLRIRELDRRLRAGDGERVRLEVSRGDLSIEAELTLKRRI